MNYISVLDHRTNEEARYLLSSLAFRFQYYWNGKQWKTILLFVHNKTHSSVEHIGTSYSFITITKQIK